MAFINIKNWFPNIKKWFPNVKKWIINIMKPFIDINKCSVFVNIDKWFIIDYVIDTDIPSPGKILFFNSMHQGDFPIKKML